MTDRQAAVGIAQHQYGVRLDGNHQLVALGDNIAHGLAQVSTHGVHIHLRVCQLKVVEEHAVQVVIVVLTSVGQDDTKFSVSDKLMILCVQPGIM